ncbi:MAG: 6-phosphofructokinase [Burkholderiales bacterium]
MATRYIAINIGSGYVPGLNAVVTGAVLAAKRLGWDVVGIRDGYDGLLFPKRYGQGGLVNLDAHAIDASARGGSVLGSGARTDPFRVRTVNADDQVEELDRSDELLRAVRAAGIDAVISIVGGSPLTGLHAASVALKLQRKGLRTVCIPKSVENDIPSVPQPFGYNSVLSHTADLLERIRIAAQDVGRLMVVDVPGQHAGWLALQSGIASLADAVLIPEIPYDLAKVAAELAGHEREGRRPALVVVAEGARPVAGASAPPDTLRASLAPNADPDLGAGEHVIDRAGAAANEVALALQRATDRDVLPLSLGHLVRGGAPTAADRQLGLAYGAGAVRALESGEAGVMVTWEAPDLKTIPLAESLSRIRTVPPSSEFVRVARSLGIAFGDQP